MIKVVEWLSFNDLKAKCWSGAINTLEVIEENDKTNELMDLLKDTYYGEWPSLTDVNDFLWFDDEFIYESLGIEVEDDYDS